jgi:hypothetical protein
MKIDPVSETLLFLVFRILYDGQSLKISNSDYAVIVYKFTTVELQYEY